MTLIESDGLQWLGKNRMQRAWLPKHVTNNILKMENSPNHVFAQRRPVPNSISTELTIQSPDTWPTDQRYTHITPGFYPKRNSTWLNLYLKFSLPPLSTLLQSQCTHHLNIFQFIMESKIAELKKTNNAFRADKQAATLTLDSSSSCSAIASSIVPSSSNPLRASMITFSMRYFFEDFLSLAAPDLKVHIHPCVFMSKCTLFDCQMLDRPYFATGTGFACANLCSFCQIFSPLPGQTVLPRSSPLLSLGQRRPLIFSILYKMVCWGPKYL